MMPLVVFVFNYVSLISTHMYVIVPCVNNLVLFSFQIIATLVVLQAGKLLGIITFDDISLVNIKKVSSPAL